MPGWTEKALGRQGKFGPGLSFSGGRVFSTEGTTCTKAGRWDGVQCGAWGGREAQGGLSKHRVDGDSGLTWVISTYLCMVLLPRPGPELLSGEDTEGPGELSAIPWGR